MQLNEKGFTVKNLVITIFIFTILAGSIAPMAIRSTGSVFKKARAAADAESLRSIMTDVTIALLDDNNIKDITDQIDSVVCETDPDAVLWLNYTKPVSLNAYFVSGDNYYSIDYLSEIALHGSSDVDLKKPLSLGFWYEVGNLDK